MCPVPQAVMQGVDDEVALDFGHLASDHPLGAVFLLRRRGAGGSAGEQDGCGLDLVARRQQHGAVHGVLKLAHVAGPVMVPQQFLGIGRQRQGVHPVGFRVHLDEVQGQHLDVAGALRKGRDSQVDHVEAEVKVVAEAPGGHFFLHVAVGGGDDADVHLDRLGAADAVDFAFLDGAQYLGLKRRRHLAYFVEQQGAAVGLLELAQAPGHGAREGPLLVAEEFGFEEGFRDGGAIHGDERGVGALAFGMNVAGQKFLAGSGPSGDQDGGGGAGHPLGHHQDVPHGGVLVDDGVAFLRHGGEHGGDEVRVRGQRDIFLGSRLDGADRGPGVGADAAGDHGHRNPFPVKAFDEGGHVQAHVDHHQVRALAVAQGLEAAFDVIGLGHLGAAGKGDLSGRADLAREGADDE